MNARLANAEMVLLLAVGALLPGACTMTDSGNPLRPTDENAMEADNEWQFLQGALEEKTFHDAGNEITLVFHDGRLSGHGGVNQYSAPVKVAGQEITLTGPIVTTRMLGPRAAMRLENDYLSALREVSHYRRSGAKLRLFGGQGMVLRFHCPTCRDR